MKKNIIFITITSILTILTLTLLTIFCFPSQIPLHINIYGKIDLLCSKWIFFIGLAFILAFGILSITLKTKQFKIFFRCLFSVIAFELILIGIYYSIEPAFLIGTPFKLPISIILTFPISFMIIVWANLLKSTPYKSKFGIE